MSSKTVSASVLFDFDKVEHNRENVVHMDVVISAPEKETDKRIPLQLILAIDCSGSMEGGKLDSVKDTASKLIKNLTENDTLGVIGFSENAFEVLPNLPMNTSNKERAGKAILSLHTIGATNISAAFAMSMERAVTAEKDKVSRIILLTDGLPTAGECNKQTLVEMTGKGNSSVSISTFGYGNDYDAELLASMASIGKGNNFYIQSADDCNKAFALELGGLLSLYGQDITVTMVPSGNVKIHSLMSDYKLEEKPGYRGITPGSVSFKIDDIYGGEKKHAILKMVVPEATEAVCARATRICDIKVDYLNVDTKTRVNVEASAKIQYVKPGKNGDKPNSDVQKQLAMIEAARIQKEAKEKADTGDYKGAQVILANGITWVTTNPWLDQGTGTAVKSMFQNLNSSCESRFSYATLGTKQFASYTRGLMSNRASSGDTMAMSYSNAVMDNMVKSFDTDEPMPVATVSSAYPVVKNVNGTTTNVTLTSDTVLESMKKLMKNGSKDKNV
jgi:Ca-activated chloride channel family protein